MLLRVAAVTETTPTQDALHTLFALDTYAPVDGTPTSTLLIAGT